MCSHENGRNDTTAPNVRGIFSAPVFTEEGAAWILNQNGLRTSKDRLIFGENEQTKNKDGEYEGVPSLDIGNHFLIRAGALEKWVEKFEQVQKRPRKKGGRRCQTKAK
jgi:hypothetical protein